MARQSAHTRRSRSARRGSCYSLAPSLPAAPLPWPASPLSSLRSSWPCAEHARFSGRGPRPACYLRGMAAVETCRLPVDGGDAVFCEVTGHGPPLELTHDAIVHREIWDAQFEALSRSCRVVRWDRRGYGRSDPPSTPYASDNDLAR